MVYIQHDSPGADKEANWQPSTSEEVRITMRISWPKEKALDGKGKPAPVAR